jgi:hypothetical protein
LDYLKYRKHLDPNKPNSLVVDLALSLPEAQVARLFLWLPSLNPDKQEWAIHQNKMY